MKSRSKLGLWIGRIGLVGLLGFLGLLMAQWLTPFPAELLEPPAASPEFVDRHGQSLRLLLVEETRFHRQVPLPEISPVLIHATLAAEDARFFQHGGVDFRALARATGEVLRRSDRASGASTITQQLIKQIRPGPRTFARKLSEVWLALRVERSWSKEQILEAYLNRLDYGNLQGGIGAASRFYFGKPAMELSPAEAAFLAALPNAPTRLNPYENFAGAQVRQDWILQRMEALGFLDEAAARRARQEPLQLHPREQVWAAPYFVDLLLRRTGLLPQRSATLRTTLDLDLTNQLEAILSAQLQEVAPKNVTAGAVIVLHNPTGEVRALAGRGNINGAWEPRSPGSALKPFTYLLALEKGAYPGTIVPDIPTEFSTPTGVYRPNNYNHRFHGPVSLRHALGNSLNIAAIRTLQLGGGPEALHKLLIASGVTTLGFPPEHYGLGLTLGNGEVRLLELANAYAALARGGVWQPFRLLQSPATSLQPGPARRICSEESAWLLADMLSDDQARAASFGLDSYLSLPFPVACKTGTSSNYRDNVIVGYTPDFTVAVWVGNADNSPMHGITGVTGAAPVLYETFTALNKRKQLTWFQRPAGIQSVRVHALTGKRLGGEQGGLREKAWHLPPLESPEDYDATGRVLLGPEYSAWLNGAQNSLGALVASSDASPTSSASLPLQILHPKPGTIFFLDPDLPPGTQRIALQARPVGACVWTSPSLAPEMVGGIPRVQLAPGRHEFLVEDPATGRTASTWIEVRDF